jgi:acyl-CoA oxidase
MSDDRVTALDDPQLRPFVPLLYVAWSDLDLDPDDQAALLERIEAQPWLRPAARDALAAWTDRTRPVTASELARIRGLIDRVAATASPRARRSFAALASSIADTEQARTAAGEIAAALGMPVGAGAEPEAAAREVDPAQVAALAIALDGSQAEARARARDFLAKSDPRVYGLPAGETRDIVRRWLGDLAATGLGTLAFPGVTATGTLEPFMAAFEELGHGNLSLLVKWGVQMGLYGGSLWALGTERHRARLAAVARLDELGCFAMSEVGHGSNVSDLETIARYDAKTRELVIHTPGESARKEWIGGAAHDARWAVVFAQLEVGDERHGVHAVLVPIRGADGADAPGVRTGDCGHKLGLNGVDNGRLWFEHVRVPVDNLLDRFARIDDGRYTSPIASPERRFFAMLGTLVGGRISVGSSAVSAGRTALAIAIRYAGQRRQFGPRPASRGDFVEHEHDEAGGERRLLDYPTHRRRLLPHLADSVVLRLAFEELRARHAEVFTTGDDATPADTRALEAEVAALKVLGSRHGVAAVQAAREACGGQGYLSVNRLAELRADVEIFTTFEGDNTVLSQLVAKSVLAGYRKQFSDGGAAAVLRAVVRRGRDAVVEKNPVQIRRTDPAHLRDREFHLAALRHREEHVIATCAARIKARLDRGVAPDAARRHPPRRPGRCSAASAICTPWRSSSAGRRGSSRTATSIPARRARSGSWSRCSSPSWPRSPAPSSTPLRSPTPAWPRPSRSSTPPTRTTYDQDHARLRPALRPPRRRRWLRQEARPEREARRYVGRPGAGLRAPGRRLQARRRPPRRVHPGQERCPGVRLAALAPQYFIHSRQQYPPRVAVCAALTSKSSQLVLLVASTSLSLMRLAIQRPETMAMPPRLQARRSCEKVHRLLPAKLS